MGFKKFREDVIDPESDKKNFWVLTKSLQDVAKRGRLKNFYVNL